MDQDFHGAKAAVFIGTQLLVYVRDNDVVWPSHWDFPGGGREGTETPFECLQREVYEEFGLQISDASITWRKEVPSMVQPSEVAWFFVAHLPQEAVKDIRFGAEGQRWALMSVQAVADLPNLVPGLGERLKLWLQQSGREPI